MANEQKKKKRYESYYKLINPDKKKPPKPATLSYEQWKKASATDIAFSQAGKTLAMRRKRGGTKL